MSGTGISNLLKEKCKESPKISQMIGLRQRRERNGNERWRVEEK